MNEYAVGEIGQEEVEGCVALCGRDFFSENTEAQGVAEFELVKP